MFSSAFLRSAHSAIHKNSTESGGIDHEKILANAVLWICEIFTCIPDSGVPVGIFHSPFYLQKVVSENGGGTLIKRNAYFGDGHGISIGENSQIGLNAVLSTDVTLGDNVVMGPDVIIYSNSHEYADVNIPINQQGMKKSNPVTIGNNVWIGARVVILPGVTIGDNCIIGANTVVTKSVPANSVVTGYAGRVVKTRT